MPDMSALDDILSEIAQGTQPPSVNRQTSQYAMVKVGYPNGSSSTATKENGSSSLPRNRPSLPKLQRAYERALQHERSSAATSSCSPDLNVPSPVAHGLNKSSSAAAYHHLSPINIQQPGLTRTTNGSNGNNGTHVGGSKDANNSSTFPRRSATLASTQLLSASARDYVDSSHMPSQVTLRRSVSPISTYKEQTRKAAEIPCPFGTFLNLDFVDFCSDLANIRLPESVKRFRESSSKRKKKWRKSMDQMLYTEQVLQHATLPSGGPPHNVPLHNGTTNGKLDETSSEQMEEDSKELTEAVRTFEQTLLRQMSNTWQNSNALRIVEEDDEDLPLSIASSSTTSSNEKKIHLNGFGNQPTAHIPTSPDSYRESLFTVPHIRAPKVTSSSSPVSPLVTSTKVFSITKSSTTFSPPVAPTVSPKGSPEVETSSPASFRQNGPKSSSTTSLNHVSIPAEVLEGIRDKLAQSVTQMSHLQQQADLVPRLREEISALRLMLQQVGQIEKEKAVLIDAGMVTSPVPDERHDETEREPFGDLVAPRIVECQSTSTNTEVTPVVERRDSATCYSPTSDFASSSVQTESPDVDEHVERSQSGLVGGSFTALTARPSLERKISRSVRKTPRSKFAKRKQSIASRRRPKHLPSKSVEPTQVQNIEPSTINPIEIPSIKCLSPSIAVIDELDLEKDDLELVEEAELMEGLHEKVQIYQVEEPFEQRPVSEEVISDNEVNEMNEVAYPSPPFSLLGDSASSTSDVDSDTVLVPDSGHAPAEYIGRSETVTVNRDEECEDQDHTVYMSETSIVMSQFEPVRSDREVVVEEKMTFVEVYDNSYLSPIHEEESSNEVDKAEEETQPENFPEEHTDELTKTSEVPVELTETVGVKETNEPYNVSLSSENSEELDMVASLSSASEQSQGAASNSDPDDEGSYDLLHGEISHKCPEENTTAQPVETLYKVPEQASLENLDEIGESGNETNDREEPRTTASPSAPSKELLAAAKVLKDSLHRGAYTNNSSKGGRSEPSRNQDTSKRIIQQEWFSVAGRKDANAESVDNYIDVFESFSKKLLSYVVNLLDNNGNTVLHYALSHNNFDVVSVLLDSKVCNVDIVNQAGYTPVMLASLAILSNNAHRAVTSRLFGMCDINRRAQQHGQTALMLAVSHGRVDTVKMLLDVGADVNIQDNDGSTALMCASEHGHIEIVRLLLRHPDVNVEMTDGDGMNALYVALEAGHKDIAALLYNRRSSVPEVGSTSHIEDRRQSLGDAKRPTNVSIDCSATVLLRYLEDRQTKRTRSLIRYLKWRTIPVYNSEDVRHFRESEGEFPVWGLVAAGPPLCDRALFYSAFEHKTCFLHVF